MFKLPDRQDGEVLFANRDLEFVFLHPAVWASPLLWTRANGLPSWFWRCDLNFLSWVNGVAAKAGDKLPAAALERVNFVRSCVCAEYGITDDNFPDTMPAPGASLDASFPIDSLGAIDFDLAPPWPGLAVAARAAGYSEPLPFRFQGRAAQDAWIAEQKAAARLTDDEGADDESPVPEAKPKRKRK